MRVVLTTASYTARSIIASASRCVNLYPELNPSESPVPLTFYPRPGGKFLISDPMNARPVRGLYRTSQNQGIAVIGSTVYQLTPGPWTLTPIGSISSFSSLVSMIDNHIDLLIVDGSPGGGWTWPLDGSSAVAPIVDGTGTFQGSTRVDYLDTFLMGNTIGTNQWWSTLSNSITFDPLYIAAKTAFPDPLATLIVNRREILLLGSLARSEIWYDAGNPLFPFAILPGAYVEHGCIAPRSVASSDLSIFWLSQDAQGQGIVLRKKGYDTQRVSNHALEFAISEMLAAGLLISDAIAYTYQQQGHTFYILTFPSGDATWAFDDSLSAHPEAAWAQRGWGDTNGIIHRERINCFMNFSGLQIGGDWENGSLYSIDPGYFQDDFPSAAAPQPLTLVKGFPHISTLPGARGGMLPTDGKRIKFKSFMADIECGLDESDIAPTLNLRYSDDRGRSFSNPIELSMGLIGQYNTWPIAQDLGYSRDRIFELFWSTNAPSALNGAWVDAEVEDS